MLSTIDLRLAHYPSRTPILIELKNVSRDTTVRQLRAQIISMQADEHCLMRVFGRLFVEMQAGAVKRLSAIEACDEGESLLRLGVEDGDVLYLEGPVTDSAAGVGMAIALLNEKLEQQSIRSTAQSAEYALQMKRLEEECAEGRKVMQQLLEEIHLLRGDMLQRHRQSEEQAHKLESATSSKLAETKKHLEQLFAAGFQDVATIDHGGMTPLHHAAEQGHVAAMELLLAKGADAKAADKNGSTPLNSAAEGGHVAAMEFLLSKGADAKAANKNGYTPMFSAAKGGHVAAMEWLLSKGVDVQLSSGANALHFAAAGGKVPAIEWLISKGLDVNSRDKDGCTPLHKAANRGQVEAIEALLAKGADVRATDSKGLTPLATWKEAALKPYSFIPNKDAVGPAVEKLLAPI